MIQCLKAVDIELKDQKGQYEIILVDSSPIAPELDSIKNLKLLHANLQLFPSEARNLGARMAKFPILVFIDSDLKLLPGALARLIHSLKDNNAVASGVYVARVKSGGNERMLKIALVQESQVLKYY